MTLSDALKPLAGQYPDAFLRAMAFLLPWECVFPQGHDEDYAHVIPEDVSFDNGGTTKWGIDRSSHPGVDIKNLTLAGAVAIYYQTYWKGVQGNALPPDVAIAVFDAAVNCGVGRAAKWLQQAVGVTQDGQIGPKTLAAVRGKQDGLTDELLDLREDFYRRIGSGSEAKFLAGWLNRVDALRKFLSQQTQ